MKEAGEKKEKLSPALLYRQLSAVISRRCLDMPVLGEKYHVIETNPGERQVLLEGADKVVCNVGKEAVVGSLVKYLECNYPGKGMYALTVKQSQACVDYWVASTDPIKEPKYLAEKSDPSLCYHRLPMNYDDADLDTPVIDDFINRCTNKGAVMMYIGSLLVENSSRTQYLWIYGPGGEGKGSFGRGLVNILGPGCITMAVPNTDSQKQFLTYSLKGKRVCLFPECNNYSFPRDALFKQLTGGDNVWFEQKGKMGHSGKINCKFIFLSNEQPNVHGTSANLRRMIYSEVSAPTTSYAPSVYDALMTQQMPSFLIKCRALYLDKCPQGEDIEYDDPTTNELIEGNEEAVEYLTDRFLVKDAHGSISSHRLREIKELEKLSENAYRMWVRYLKSNHGAVYKLVRSGGNVTRHWTGIRERNALEYVSWTVEKNSSIKDIQSNS